MGTVAMGMAMGAGFQGRTGGPFTSVIDAVRRRDPPSGGGSFALFGWPHPVANTGRHCRRPAVSGGTPLSASANVGRATAGDTVKRTDACYLVGGIAGHQHGTCRSAK